MFGLTKANEKKLDALKNISDYLAINTSRNYLEIELDDQSFRSCDKETTLNAQVSAVYKEVVDFYTEDEVDLKDSVEDVVAKLRRVQNYLVQLKKALK